MESASLEAKEEVGSKLRWKANGRPVGQRAERDAHHAGAVRPARISGQTGSRRLLEAHGEGLGLKSIDSMCSNEVVDVILFREITDVEGPVGAGGLRAVPVSMRGPLSSRIRPTASHLGTRNSWLALPSRHPAGRRRICSVS